MQFPVFKTKIKGLDRKFNLIDPKEQEEYFDKLREKRDELERMHNPNGKTDCEQFTFTMIKG